MHTVAGILKSYLRELPDPVLVAALYDDWIGAIKIADLETRLGALNDVTTPDYITNYITIIQRYFFYFCCIAGGPQVAGRQVAKHALLDAVLSRAEPATGHQ